MRLLLSLVAFLLFATSAQALKVISPPRRYDNPHPDLIVLEVARPQVSKICRQLFGRNFRELGEVYGCASVGDAGSSCVIVLPPIGEAGISSRDRKALFRHEQAHCNGWSSDHSNR